MKYETLASSPSGVFSLGCEYLDAAWVAFTVAKGLTHGPARLLAHQSCVLFLNAYLRSRSVSSPTAELNALIQDLPTLLREAKRLGWAPPKGTLKVFATFNLEQQSMFFSHISEAAARTRTERALKITEAIRNSIGGDLDIASIDGNSNIPKPDG